MNTSTGKLVLCPTPIGNLGDITLRTLDELRAADVVCAEDTRVTGKLLAHFDIEKRRAALMKRPSPSRPIALSSACWLASASHFAAMPACLACPIPVAPCCVGAGGGAPYEVLPGASAAATAYVASGFPIRATILAVFSRARPASAGGARSSFGPRRLARVL